MKKFLAILLSLTMLLGLAACQKEPVKESEGPSATDPAATAAPTEAPTEAPTDPAPAYEFPGDLYGTGAVGENGGAACASPIAAQIAVDILKAGGNAVDAAVAMAYAVGLLEPAASGLGGASQMLIYLAEQDKYVVIDGMTQAPGAAMAGMIETSTSSNPPSVEAIAIPGFVHGTMTALELYGTMTPAQVLEPVIKLAREGFPVSSRWNTNIEGRYENLSAYPYTMGLYTDEGFLYNVDDTITNNDLADTMQMIADHGADGFYNSELTAKMVQYIRSLGGIVTEEDFHQYHSVVREAYSTTYNGYRVYTIGGPSNGGIPLLEMLNILENFNLSQYEPGSAESTQLILDAFAMGYQDGLAYMADPDYYNLPIDTMISKEYGAERAKSITLGKRLSAAKAGKLTVTLTETGEAMKAAGTPDQGGTTHMACMDKYGNVVSMTDTNGINFGSAVAVPGTGFVFSAHLGNLNNTGSARVNMLMPYIRVRTTMCPSIIADENGKPVAAVGSPGNWALVSAALNAIINYIDYDMNIAQAILQPRTWRDGISKAVSVDGLFNKETVAALIAMGYDPEVSSSDYDSHVGCCAGVEFRDGLFYAFGDIRRYYGAAAY